jgi:uncharacterized protein
METQVRAAHKAVRREDPLALTSVQSATSSPWSRRVSVASMLVLVLLWLLVVEPVIVIVLDKSTEMPTALLVRGFPALLLAIAFTLRGSWRVNGFCGGLKIWWWRALAPMWAVAASVLALSAITRSPIEHLQWIALACFAGFEEEAIFRGIMIRTLMPSGARRAIIWSALWFGAIHLTGLPFGFDWRMVSLVAANAFATGLILGWVRLASASIWPGVIAHAFFDYGGFIYNGSLGAEMVYSNYSAVTAGLLIGLMLAWACCLLSRAGMRTILPEHDLNSRPRRQISPQAIVDMPSSVSL